MRRTSIPDVFISHSHVDIGYVARLADHLRRCGVTARYHPAMVADDETGPDARSGIDLCYAHIPVLTPASMASHRVHREIRYAVDSRKPIQPLLLDFCSIPLVLGAAGYEDVRGGRLPSTEFTARLRALVLPNHRPAEPPPPPAPTAGPGLAPAQTAGTPGPVLRGHTDAVSGVAIAPNGGWLASSSFDGTVRLWGHDGAHFRTLAGHPNGASGVAIAPDGTWLATSGDRTVSTWEMSGRARAKLHGHNAAVWATAISAGGRYIASAGIDHTSRLWPTTGDPPTVLHGHTDAVYTVAIGPDENWLATGSADRSIHLWTPGGQTIATLHAPDAVSSVAIAPHGRWLVAATGGTAMVWHSDGTAHQILNPTQRVRCVAIARNANLIAAGCDDGTIHLYDFDRGPAGSLIGHPDVVEAVAFAPTGTWLASASKDRTVRLWNLRSPHGNNHPH